MLYLALIACGGDLLLTTGELGRLNYTLNTNYQMDEILVNEAKLDTGYPQDVSASLTLKGWTLVEETVGPSSGGINFLPLFVLFSRPVSRTTDRLRFIRSG